jgi:hypothetical protein
MAIRVVDFQMGGTKLERFLPKNQHPQRKLLNFENWISGGLRSFQKGCDGLQQSSNTMEAYINE